jgi:hypothetical protein
MTKKKLLPNRFTGSWRITWMAAWDQDFVNAEEQGYFDFTNRNSGEFHFGYVHGSMDCHLSVHEGKPCVEFSWEGNDEMDPVTGRGWAVIDGNQIQGMLFFHGGGESAFRVKKSKAR